MLERLVCSAVLCALIMVLFQFWVRQNKAGYLLLFWSSEYLHLPCSIVKVSNLVWCTEFLKEA